MNLIKIYFLQLTGRYVQKYIFTKRKLSGTDNVYFKDDLQNGTIVFAVILRKIYYLYLESFQFSQLFY